MKTPLVQVWNGVWGKLEGHLPTGSIKYRMVEHALAKERQRTGTLVVPSSGNTAAAAAAWARTTGVPCVVVVPQWCPVAKRQNAERYGARVHVAPAGVCYRKRGRELVESIKGAWVFDQYNDSRNPAAYTLTLGPELAVQAAAAGLRDYAVACTASTGGTFIGLSRYFRKLGKPMVLVEPVAGGLGLDGVALSEAVSLPGIYAATDLSAVVDERDALRAWAKVRHDIGPSGAMALLGAKQINEQFNIPVIAVCADRRSHY